MMELDYTGAAFLFMDHEIICLDLDRKKIGTPTGLGLWYDCFDCEIPDGCTIVETANKNIHVWFRKKPEEQYRYYTYLPRSTVTLNTLKGDSSKYARQVILPGSKVLNRKGEIVEYKYLIGGAMKDFEDGKIDSLDFPEMPEEVKRLLII